RELYLGTLSRLSGLDQETLRTQLATAGSIRPTSPIENARSEPPSAPERKQTTSLERYLMAQLTKFPEEAARLDLDPADLVDPVNRRISNHSVADNPPVDLRANFPLRGPQLAAMRRGRGRGAAPVQGVAVARLRLGKGT